MKQDLNYFLKEAEKCLPFASAAERRKWAEECQAQHPGFVEHHLTERTIEKQIPIPANRWVWAICMLLAMIFLALCVQIARGDDQPPPPADLPKTVEPQDREKLKDLWVDAFIALAKVNDANLAVARSQQQAAEAKLESERRQKDLDELNIKLAALLADFRKRYEAPDDKWCPTRQLTWIPKGEKPCPALFASDPAK